MKRIYFLIFFTVSLVRISYAQDVSYTPLYTNDILSRNLTANTTVGSTSGEGNVSASGAATYSIPIAIPTGTNGVAPSISLGYNSIAGSGVLGTGWSISGLSSITRASRNIYYDNLANPIELSLNDRFSLDGQRLVSKEGNYGTDNSKYGTESENFATITAHNQEGITGVAYFEIVTKEGNRMEYGKTSDARFMDASGTKVIFWRLNRVTNPDGNYVEYKYINTDRDPRIEEINYTGNVAQGLSPYNQIKFSYKTRNDQNVVYEGGSSLLSKYLLDKITVTTDLNKLVKSYQLSYGSDNINSYLKEIKEIGSDGTTMLNATSFKYGDVPQAFVTEEGPSLATTSIVDYFSGDFDGNGKSDILLAHFSLYPIVTSTGTIVEKKFTKLNVYRDGDPNRATGFIDLDLGTQIKTNQNRGNNYSFLRGDFNGDGLDDILTSSIHTTGDRDYVDAIKIYKSKLSPNGLASDQLTFSTSGGILSFAKRIPLSRNYLFNGDFNGDGIQDVFTLLENTSAGGDGQFEAIVTMMGKENVNSERYHIVRETDKGFLGRTFEAAKRIFILDFDGDGKDDIMTVSEGSLCQIYKSVAPVSIDVLGGGGYSFKLVYSSTTFLKGADKNVYFGDFNGDGKMDILYQVYADGVQNSLPWLKAISTGTGFESSSFVFQSANGVLPDTEVLHVADFNGDGKADVYHQYKPGGDPSKSDVYYSTNNGYYFQQYTPNLDVVPGYGVSSVPFDLNGDGRSEILVRKNNSFLNIISLKKSGRENILEKVSNGIGHVTSWTYKNLSEGGSFYKKGAVSAVAYPFNSIQLPLYVVSTFNNGDGRDGQNFNYLYEDAKLHREGKGLLGFTKVLITNTATQYRTTSENEFNTTFYIPLPKKTKTENIFLDDDDFITQTTYTNEVKDLGNKRYLIKTTGIENIGLGGAVSTTVNIIDDNGNITKSTANINNQESLVTETEYVARPGEIPNRPSKLSLSTTRGSEATYLLTTKFGYSNIGSLITKTEFDGLADSLGVVYEYFPLGNLKKTTITPKGNNVPLSRSTSHTYDDKGRYIVTSTNELGQTSSVSYHPTWGSPMVATGVNGLKTKYSYNAFGRLSETTFPEGYSIQDTLIWGESNNLRWYNKIIHPGKHDVKSGYDVLGREVKTEMEGYDGAIVTKTSTYDIKGNLETSTDPYKTGEEIVIETRTYDDFNRLSQIKSSVSSRAGSVSFGYSYENGNLTTLKKRFGVSAAEDQQVSTVTDATGRTVSVTDPGGTLNYSYYSHGAVKEIKIGTVTMISNEYDAYGNQTKMTDKNAGTTQYQYNIFGELIKQVNANGKETTLLYDLLGRNYSRSGEEGVTSYEFYPSGSNASTNQLKKITGFSGDVQDHVYNTDGRIQTITEKIDNQSYITNYTYNIYGDITSKSYPSGLKINYHYNNLGYLKEIKNTDNTVTLYSNSEMNGRSQVTKYSLGNGKSSVNTYVHGFPTKYETPNVQNLSQSWSYGLGILNSRANNVTRNGNNFIKSESFVHDNLDRLKTITNGSATFSTTYAANGNINSKADAGSYTYDPSRVHAVVAVSNPAPSTIPLLQQDITYTAFLKTEKLTEKNSDGSKFELQYTYGADYERLKSVTKKDGVEINTRYYLGGYDKDITAGKTKFIQYIDTPVGLAAIVLTEDGTHTYHYVYNDHLGSIVTVTDKDGGIVADQSFDAWGRRRDPLTWELLGPTAATALPSWLYKGYTGHEHLDNYGLVNMNGRMYDPVLGRMLSADNVVPNEASTQGYNRYSYAYNSPLKYTDPDGNNPIPLIIKGMFLGGFSNGIDYASNGKSFSEGFWRGALTGGLGGLGAYYAPIGVLPGALYGAATGAVTSGVAAALNGTSILKGMRTGALMGAAGGGIRGGKEAIELNADVWTGKRPQHSMDINGNIVNGSIPAQYTNEYLGRLKQENFDDIKGVRWMSKDYMPKGWKMVNGNYQYKDKKGNMREALAVTESSIWKHGGASSRIFFSKNAFASREQLSVTMAHELAHVIHANLGLELMSTEKISDGGEFFDNEGHVAIQRMTAELIMKNGWNINNMNGQVPLKVLKQNQHLVQLYQPIQTLIRIIKFP